MEPRWPSGLRDGSVYFRRADTGEELFHTPLTWEQPYSRLGYFHSYTSDFIAFSRDSRYAAIIGPESEIAIWDMKLPGEPVARAALPPDSEAASGAVYWSLEFSKEGDRLYAGVEFTDKSDKKNPRDRHRLDVLEWRPESRSLAKVSEHATERHRTLELSPDGTILASQPLDPWANLHRLPQLDRPQRLQAEIESRAFFYMRFSPDGSQLAAVGDGIQVWNVVTGKPALSIPREGPWPEHVSWSLDGRRLAVSDRALITRLWDVSTQQAVATFPGGVSALSPDGTVLATGHQGNDFRDPEGAGRVTLHRAPSLTEIDARRKAQVYGRP